MSKKLTPEELEKIKKRRILNQWMCDKEGEMDCPSLLSHIATLETSNAKLKDLVGRQQVELERVKGERG